MKFLGTIFLLIAGALAFLWIERADILIRLRIESEERVRTHIYGRALEELNHGIRATYAAVNVIAHAWTYTSDAGLRLHDHKASGRERLHRLQRRPTVR